MADRFDKFTERARRVLTLAQEEAQRFNHNYIGTEHLLLGLVREGDGVAAKVLANLGVELDLYSIAQKVTDVEYEHEQFPGAILKLKDPKASLLLFKNGKVICTGSKSEAEVKHALERAIKLLMLE